MEAEQIIQEMVRRLVERFAPRKIILFGSRASAKQSPDSDVDLLLIINQPKNLREIRLAMRRELNGLGLPKDIVVMTSREFEAKRKIPGTIAYPADQEGKVLYGG